MPFHIYKSVHGDISYGPIKTLLPCTEETTTTADGEVHPTTATTAENHEDATGTVGAEWQQEDAEWVTHSSSQPHASEFAMLDSTGLTQIEDDVDAGAKDTGSLLPPIVSRFSSADTTVTEVRPDTIDKLALTTTLAQKEEASARQTATVKMEHDLSLEARLAALLVAPHDSPCIEYLRAESAKVLERAAGTFNLYNLTRFKLAPLSIEGRCFIFRPIDDTSFVTDPTPPGVCVLFHNDLTDQILLEIIGFMRPKLFTDCSTDWWRNRLQSKTTGCFLLRDSNGDIGGFIGFKVGLFCNGERMMYIDVIGSNTDCNRPLYLPFSGVLITGKLLFSEFQHFVLQQLNERESSYHMVAQSIGYSYKRVEKKRVVQVINRRAEHLVRAKEFWLRYLDACPEACYIGAQLSLDAECAVEPDCLFLHRQYFTPPYARLT